MSRPVRHQTVINILGYCKLCAYWVPQILTGDHKQKSNGCAQAFLAHYEEQGEDFLDWLVTYDALWYLAAHLRISDNQSNDTTNTHHQQNFKTSTSARKIISTILWDRKSPLSFNVLTRWHTINSAAYCKMLRSSARNAEAGSLYSTTTPVRTVSMALRNCCSPSGGTFWRIHCTVHISHFPIFLQWFLSWRYI